MNVLELAQKILDAMRIAENNAGFGADVITIDYNVGCEIHNCLINYHRMFFI